MSAEVPWPPGVGTALSFSEMGQYRPRLRASGDQGLLWPGSGTKACILHQAERNLVF